MVQDHYRFTLQALLKPKECACHSHGVLLNFSPASLPLAGAEYIAVVYTLWADCSNAVIALICDNQLPFGFMHMLLGCLNLAALLRPS